MEVHTKNNEIFMADYVLCTFSTGVLTSDTIIFDPPLPEWKKEAIYKNPMSVYTKIFLKFPRKFWDDHEFILHASKRRGYLPVFQDLDRPGILPGSGILLITVTGEEGKRIEEQTDQETKTEIMKTLRKIYGRKIPDPTGKYVLSSFVQLPHHPYSIPPPPPHERLIIQLRTQDGYFRKFRIIVYRERS